MAAIARPMTEDEFLALPDVDGLNRELIRGELVERPTTVGAYAHSVVIGAIAYHLHLWLARQPMPRGTVVGGRAGVRLRPDPPTIVGVDVAYVQAELKPDRPRTSRYVDGPPVLVVEVLSFNETFAEIAAKVAEYLDAGVAIVWAVDTLTSTITVHRPDARPQLFNLDREIAAEPWLPGFRVAVAELFEDLDD